MHLAILHTLNHFSRWMHQPRRLFYVTDEQDWVLKWVAHYLVKHLHTECDIEVSITDSPWSKRRQIIHFGDRYVYLNGNSFRQLHRSNHVFLTWFHGDPRIPKWTPLFASLAEAAPSLERIVVSCSAARRVLVDYGLPAELLVMIPLGVDLGLFQPATDAMKMARRRKLGIPPDAVCIGSFQKDGVGWADGLEPKLEKGPDVFLETISVLHRRIGNLFVVLTGPARGYVMQGLAQLGVPYLHRQLENYPDIAAYYHLLDLYIIASRDEGGPKALFESWATGIPVVSTRMGMPADLIQHGRNGMLAEIEDTQFLAEAALRLIEDHVLWQQCREQALQDVQVYAWPYVARQYYEQLYSPYLFPRRHK